MTTRPRPTTSRRSPRAAASATASTWDEPGCAVRGAVPADRLAGFHKLAGERRAAAAKQEAARRLAETRRVKGRKPRRKPDDQG